MNCLHLYRTKNKLKSHENVCKNHDYCNIKMPEGYNKILKFTQNHKSMKIRFVIYENKGPLLEKIQVCDNIGKYRDVTYSICNLGYRCHKKFLCCSLIVLIMIIIS